MASDKLQLVAVVSHDKLKFVGRLASELTKYVLYRCFSSGQIVLYLLNNDLL